MFNLLILNMWHGSPRMTLIADALQRPQLSHNTYLTHINSQLAQQRKTESGMQTNMANHAQSCSPHLPPHIALHLASQRFSLGFGDKITQHSACNKNMANIFITYYTHTQLHSLTRHAHKTNTSNFNLD